MSVHVLFLTILDNYCISAVNVGNAVIIISTKLQATYIMKAVGFQLSNWLLCEAVQIPENWAGAGFLQFLALLLVQRAGMHFVYLQFWSRLSMQT